MRCLPVCLTHTLALLWEKGQIPQCGVRARFHGSIHGGDVDDGGGMVMTARPACPASSLASLPPSYAYPQGQTELLVALWTGLFSQVCFYRFPICIERASLTS